MNKLLKKLLGLLFPGIDGENDDPLPDDPESPDSVDDDDVDLPDDDLPDDPPVRAAPRRSDADDRLARLEAEVQSARRQADEVRNRQPAPVDAQMQREEERLRDPNTTEMERWQIEANRTLRATQQEARQAMFQAQDLSDRTRFESKFTSDPRRAKYADRVEEEIQKARSRGQMNASREDAYFWMLGKDIADGKLKPKAKTSTAPNVNRGKPAGVRSDVQGRGRPSSDHDKRRARLENTNI
jgi:hypothetical protein